MATKPGAQARARARAFARRVRVAAEYEKVAHDRRSSIDDNLVVYESFSGNGMLCNPEAIFRALLAAPDQQHLRHVWALVDFEQYAETIAEFAEDPRVEFVEYESTKYFAALARAKYLVNNATFPAQFGKREGQVYLNTWHGTPLKAMGYDIPDGAGDTRNVVRNFLATDYLLAPNEDTADMYLRAYRLRNIFRGKLVASGSPRVDAQFAGDDARRRTRAKLRERGVVLDDAQDVLLYAPTWKGNFYSPTNDIRQLRTRVETVSSQIDTARYRLLLKVHQQVYKHAIADPALRDILVPNDVPANEMLGATDVLITDYSSIFIDFLATGRPILFFAPDLEEYEAQRGLYLPTAQWPGAISTDIAQLVADIKNLGTGTDDDPAVRRAAAYAAARERYCPREDGHAAERVVDVVFRGRAGDDVRSNFSDGRTSILMHLGGMLNNGITTSALCLLNNIDYERFDVSVTFNWSTHRERQRQIKLIDPRARLLPRMGGINGSKVQVKALLSVNPRLADPRFGLTAGHRGLLRDEWRRCFGDSEFDHVVDFSSYAPFWVKLLGSRPSGKFAIWFHNDMRAEVENAGRTKHIRQSVNGVLALCGLADRLVSVSAALDEVNREKLSRYASPEKFTYARNTINFERIHHLATGVPARSERITQHENVPVEPVEHPDAELALPDAVQQLMNRYGAANIRDEVDRRVALSTVLPPAPGVRTFVTAGRLSTEKNHLRMIKAFGAVHEEDPATRLVLLGTGPLRARLGDAVEDLGLASAVTLAGHQPNPYVIMANSDCFVLSSDYEGQPMVILEALVLGLPVVTTGFSSVRGALPEGYGKVVKLSVNALADGMRAFLRGEVPTLPFDDAAYNREATQEFYRAINAG